MKTATIIVTLVALKSCFAVSQIEETENYLSRFLADLWLEGGDMVKIIWRDCSKKVIDVKDLIERKEYYPKFVQCMKLKTLRAIDRTLNMDIIPIAEGVNLVRFELADQAGNVLTVNGSSSWSDTDLELEDWRTLAIQRIGRVLRTHVIKFEFTDNKLLERAEQRGRRRYHMLTMMMFGIVSIGMVLVPMGFQFLAVLGGKALVLAKMALILASIQGLKKIASNPLNYGYYPYPYDHYDRRSNDGVLTALKNLRTRHNDGQDKLINPINIKPILSQPKDKHDRDFPHSLNIAPIDTPIVDLTTHPGEVQATYSLKLPYNGLNFHAAPNVVST
ncbi:uncharacterized protein LOC123720396 [Pieris brassicae]|uniref:uncharacterized protein LOC123720396 n=1 Tax=Pieris brassicae TaxID=7116 RepID=UPI001E6616FE|nr:uncharacterized protein LOC123720396 [Pieris brassicae]